MNAAAIVVLGMALTLSGCVSHARPASPHVWVRLVIDGVPEDDVATGLATWLRELGLERENTAGVHRECDPPWWTSTVACEVSIGIQAVTGLRERAGTDSQSVRATRAIQIDPRMFADKPLLWTAIAHELGHVLLNTPEHTKTGVMAGQDWSLHDDDRALIRRVMAR